MAYRKLDTDYLRSQIIGVDTEIETPFGKRLMSYADYTASGRSLHFIENYLQQLEQLYANSHTEDDTSGRVTTQLLHHAERRIKEMVNAGPHGRIIACGTGATGAIDRMQQLVGVKLPAASRLILNNLLDGFLGDEKSTGFKAYCRDHQPVVFVGPYEHHSNEVSWREGMATVVEVRLTHDGGIDLAHLEQLLQDPSYQNRLRIGSFSAASNVTGMRSPVDDIARLLHRYNALAFFDFAACAPYVPIDMNPENSTPGDTYSLDAVFISPHKFLGGPGSSGILVFNERCYHPELPPSIAGGGTVDYVGPNDHDFIHDVETRENAGTPGILQTLRAALAFEVKEAAGIVTIEAREQEMTRRAFERWSAHPGIEILGNQDPLRRISIISFNIHDPGGKLLHPRFVTVLLNDLFGIQTRAGCSCAGPYGHQLLHIDQQTADEYRSCIIQGYSGIKPGWCRIGFHYVFDEPEVEFLLDCVCFVADHGHLFLNQYRYDPHSGVWEHATTQAEAHSFSLAEAMDADAVNISALSSEKRKQCYNEYLNQARNAACSLDSHPG
ncbi:MAG: aminotransferase class V-fold PLP-dependent enzyme [Candidatus Sedimenticola sp. PURPLELP]